MLDKFNTFAIKSTRMLKKISRSIIVKTKTTWFLNSGGDRSKIYYCPCCNKYTTSFLDWSNKYKNVICPYCDSQHRHRLLSLYLKEKKDILNSQLKILHFAPEPGIRKEFSQIPNFDYITADLNDSSVDVKIDITQIPYPDNTFDVIFCSHVLEHVPDDRRAIRELFRVLKPGCWAFLQVPMDFKRATTFEDPNIVSPADRLRYFWQEDHVRLYGLDYKDRLEEAGFIVKIEKYAQELSPEKVKQFGLYSWEDLYFGIKPNP